MYIIIITNKRGEDSSPGLPVHGGGGGGGPCARVSVYYKEDETVLMLRS